MAKRKSRLQETAVPQVGTATAEPKNQPAYRDTFQRETERRIEDVAHKIEGKGKTLLYALGALAVLGILFWIFSSYSRRANGEAQFALGKAIETSTAQVTTQPLPAGSTQKSFKTEKERAEAAYNEFQAVAEKYGSPVKEKAQYFAAVNRLWIDRNAAITDLEGLAKSSGEVGTLSKFALAQAKANDGKNDEAVALYQEILNASDTVVSKDTINYNLAVLYDKMGKKTEAADIYYAIAKAGSEAKVNDKPVPMSQTANLAKEKLKAIDPKRAAEIKSPEPTEAGNGAIGPDGVKTYTF